MAEIKFREGRCKGCELCVAVCPKSILKLRESDVNALGYHPVYIEKPDECTGCANCALMCPDGVISVYKETKRRGG